MSYGNNQNQTGIMAMEDNKALIIQPQLLDRSWKSFLPKTFGNKDGMLGFSTLRGLLLRSQDL